MVSYTVTPQSQRDKDIIQESMLEFQQLQTWRAVFAQHWEEIAELIDPPSRNTFYYGTFNWPGQKKAERQVDATAMLALERFKAILDSLLTPRNMTWQYLEADNEYVNKDRASRLWFEQATKILFKQRYNPISNFSAQNQGVFHNLGAYGAGPMFVDRYLGIDGAKGLRYKSLSLGEAYLRENHQGVVDGICRWYKLNGRQAVQKFGEKNLPPSLLAAFEQKSEMVYDFLHRVCPRQDYDKDRLDAKGKLYASYHICLSFQALCQQEGGYNTFPVPTSRYIQTPTDGAYGRSPAMMVLPAIKTLNSQKRDYLTQGHRRVSPVLLTADDGIVDISMRPGAINKGGWSPDGHPLIGTLPVGDLQTSEEMMNKEAELINAAFLVDLFKVLLDDPKIYSATQVVEMMSQRGILIAPTIGRQQSEYLGPMTERELDLLSDQGMLPPMPPRLKEAKGEYKIVYASPLARDQRSQEVAGFTRTLDLANQVAQSTGDPSVFDRFDFDTALPEIANIQSTPERWMSSDELLAQKRQQRAQLMQRQQQANEMPAKAAMVKAAAVAAKAGVPPNQLQQSAPAGPQQP